MRIAVAALTEDGGHGVLAGLLLGVGELLEPGVDDGVEAFLEAGKGRFHRALDGGRDEVVGDEGGQLLGDEGIGVGFADVDAFAGFAAEELLLELHEHGGCARGGSRCCRCLRRVSPWKAWRPSLGRGRHYGGPECERTKRRFFGAPRQGGGIFAEL